MEKHDHGVLGKVTQYGFEYDSSMLFPIARQEGRKALSISEPLLFYGVDRWTAYELSWLNQKGVPQVALGEFEFPCTSPAIIESKSLKLYLNTFNQTCFESIDTVSATIKNDLSKVCGAEVNVTLYRLDEYLPSSLRDYQCIDQLPVSCNQYLPDATVLKCEGGVVTEKLCSHLFRALCPVTGQPDWASIFIDYTGAQISHEPLLKYLVSFRNHPGFHEQCVEQIFVDLKCRCQPQSLTVYARFMRRGGLDINPYRSTNASISVPFGREVRQ